MDDGPMDEVEVEVDLEAVPDALHVVDVEEASGRALTSWVSTVAEPMFGLDRTIEPVRLMEGHVPPEDPLVTSLNMALQMVGDPCCVSMPSHRAKLTWILELVRASLGS